MCAHKAHGLLQLNTAIVAKKVRRVYPSTAKCKFREWHRLPIEIKINHGVVKQEDVSRVYE